MASSVQPGFPESSRRLREPEPPEETSSPDPGALDREFRQALLRGLLRDCYAYQTRNTDFLRFGIGRQDRIRERVRDGVLGLANRLGFARRHFSTRKASRSLLYILENVDGLERSYRRLADAHSRRLFVELLKFRVLGPRHVKLSVNDDDYWRRYLSIDRTLLKERRTKPTPWGWDLHRYVLGGGASRIELHSSATDLMQVFFLEQYAYRRGAVVDARPGDVVIDAGGCSGDTALYFADRVGPRGKVYTFEFVPQNLEVLQANLQLNPDLAAAVTVVPRALRERSNEVLRYTPSGPGTSLAPGTVDGPLEVATLSIDDFVQREGLDRLDFIKMDIEGSELAALRGAEKTLRAFRPRLAISLYHRDEDFVVIPDYLDGLGLHYEFSLDHVTLHREETVLFARSRPDGCASQT